MFNYSGKNFYIAFKSNYDKKGCTFNFQVNILDEKETINIDEDYFVSGVIIKNEIVNYHLDLYSGDPESFSISLMLNNSLGKAKLAVKECSLTDEKCSLTS